MKPDEPPIAAPPEAATPAPEAATPAPGQAPEPPPPDPTRYGDWEKKGRCIDF